MPLLTIDIPNDGIWNATTCVALTSKKVVLENFRVVPFETGTVRVRITPCDSSFVHFEVGTPVTLASGEAGIVVMLDAKKPMVERCSDGVAVLVDIDSMTYRMGLSIDDLETSGLPFKSVIILGNEYLVPDGTTDTDYGQIDEEEFDEHEEQCVCANSALTVEDFAKHWPHTFLMSYAKVMLTKSNEEALATIRRPGVSGYRFVVKDKRQKMPYIAYIDPHRGGAKRCVFRSHGVATARKAALLSISMLRDVATKATCMDEEEKDDGAMDEEAKDNDAVDDGAVNDDAVGEVEEDTDSVGDDCLCDIVQGCSRPRNHPGICNTIILGKRNHTCVYTNVGAPPLSLAEAAATLPDLEVGELPSRADVLETSLATDRLNTVRIRPTDLPRVLVDALSEHLDALKGIPTFDNKGQMKYMNVTPYGGRRMPGLDRGYQVQVYMDKKLRWLGAYEYTTVGAVVACAVRLDTTIVDSATARAWIYMMLNDDEAVANWIAKVRPWIAKVRPMNATGTKRTYNCSKCKRPKRTGCICKTTIEAK